MAVASAIYAVVGMFIDLGISNALIHFPKPSQSALSTLYWVNVAVALLLALLLIAIAWPIAELYDQPKLSPVIISMSLALPLSAFGQQFRVIAEKELQFSKLAVIESLAAVCGLLSALFVAVMNGGVYALVSAIISSALISSSLAWLLLSRGQTPSFAFNYSEARPFLRYGAYRVGDSAFNILNGQADLLIGSAVSNSAAMGVYSVPRDLALRTANSVINPVVTRVGTSIMSRLQTDPVALKAVYLQTLKMTASINFPIYIAVAFWAGEVVDVLLGPRWGEAAFYLQLFALWGLIRSVGNPVGSLLYATGHVRRAFWWNLALLLTLPLILWVGASYGGTRGLAWAMAAIQAIIFVPLWAVLVRPVCGATLYEYASQVVPPFCAASLAAITTYIATMSINNDWLQLFVSAAIMASAYIAISLALNRAWCDAMIELLKPSVTWLRHFAP